MFVQSIKALVNRHPIAFDVSKLLLATAIPALLKPFTFDKAYERENYFSPQERRLLMTQEGIRQAVSTVLYLSSVVASWVISHRMFPGQKGVSHLANTFLGSAVLDTFLRPVITAKISRWFPSNHLPAQTAMRSLNQRPQQIPLIRPAGSTATEPIWLQPVSLNYSARYSNRPTNWPPSYGMAVNPYQDLWARVR